MWHLVPFDVWHAVWRQNHVDYVVDQPVLHDPVTDSGRAQRWRCIDLAEWCVMDAQNDVNQSKNASTPQSAKALGCHQWWCHSHSIRSNVYHWPWLEPLPSSCEQWAKISRWTTFLLLLVLWWFPRIVWGSVRFEKKCTNNCYLRL